MTANDDFGELVATLQTYLEKERSTARGSNIDYISAKKLRVDITQKLPRLTDQFADAPDIVFVRSLVNFAVRSLGDKTSIVIWQSYYKRGDTLQEIANQLDYSTRTIRRFLDQFAEKIVASWWESATQNQVPKPKVSLAQKTAIILQDEFGITERQAEVLGAFCLNRHLTRAQIQDDILVISENTLKVHIRRIVGSLQVQTLQQAVIKALPVLKKHLGDDFPQV